jgi:hypothetical protein
LARLIVFSKAAGTKKSLDYYEVLRFLVNDRLVLEVFRASGESLNALGSLLVLIKSFRIDTILVVNTAIPLGNTNKFGTSLCEIL